MLKANEFINALSDSNLLTAELLSRIRKRVSESGGKVDPRSIAKYLIDKEHLTLWQANQLLAGRRAFFLGRYKLLDRIGKGGMGVVFKARHAVMDRIVALKVMSRALLNNSQAVARFNREVKTAAALNHPNIISAYDADCVGSTHFLVMEYVDGKDLNAWLKARGVFPIAAAVNCTLQTAQGLAYANRQGMVHRDIKPVNLLVRWSPESERPVVKILDLGLARFVSETQEEGGLTRMGQTIGTPDYIAPEAAESFKDADIRADIFSLGCTLFKLLSGRLPFGGENTMEKLLARTTRDAPLVRTLRPDCPAELEAVVAKMLARNPKDRYQTPDELIAALKSVESILPNAVHELEFFREPLATQPVNSPHEIQPDADTSLADFFCDFSVSPVRDEKPVAPRPQSDDGLELLPLDEDERAATAPVEPVSPATIKPTSKPPRLVEPLSDDPLPPADPEQELLAELSGATPARSRVRGQGVDRAFRESASLSLAPTRRNAWDSPLILIGGGGLLLLLIVGSALYFSVNRRTGDELLKAANDAYKNGAYVQAVRDYDKFLEEFPDHKEASAARVFRGLARIRNVVNQGADWSAALTTTKQALAQIAGESRFGDARTELASILPTLAEGIAQRASRAKDPKLVAEGHETLALADKYVPSEIRQGQRIQAVVHSLELTSREIARSDALARAVADMKKSAEEGHSAQGYAIRKALLKTYPDLALDTGLRDAVLTVAAAERTAVQVDSTSHPAESGPLPPSTSGTISLASPQGKPAPSMAGHVLLVPIGPSVYGVDATQGSVLWRHNTGTAARVAPVKLASQPGGDCLLFSSLRNEIWRVDSQTGDIRWRQSTGATLAGSPVVSGETVWLSTLSGRVLVLNLVDGSTMRSIQLPQATRSAPVVGAGGRKVYLAGEHSSLFVLSAESGECEQVVYLGHEAGTITVPPLAVNRYLFVAENHLLDNAQLRVLVTDETSGDLRPVLDIPLEGHVDTSPQMLDRSLFVVTDLGAVYAFEVNTPGEKSALTPQAQAPAITKQHHTRLFVARSNRLWIASDELNRYDIQLAQGRLTPAARRYQGDVFQEPLTAINNVLFTARRKQGTAAVTLTALNLQSGDVYWESELAAPVAALIPLDDGKTMAVTTSGALYPIEELNAKIASTTPVARPTEKHELAGPTSTTRLGNNTVLISGGGHHPGALLVDLSPASGPSTEWLRSDNWAAAPAVLSGHVVAATRTGAICCVHRKDDSSSPQPWEPQRSLANPLNWRDPVNYRDVALLFASAPSQLYLLSIDGQPLQRLTARSQAKLDRPIGSPPAIAGDMAYLLSEDQQLVCVALPDLKAVMTWTPPAPLAWGPRAVDGAVLLTTRDGQLFCFTGQPIPAWSAHFESAPCVTGATFAKDRLLLAASDGTVIHLDANSGQELGQANTTERFSTDPAIIDGTLLVASLDGSVHSLPVPVQ
jgi:serine/threonine protein kinase/outer membrane protein assembly factor BamB